jgi:hypothetical protein
MPVRASGMTASVDPAGWAVKLDAVASAIRE